MQINNYRNRKENHNSMNGAKQNAASCQTELLTIIFFFISKGREVYDYGNVHVDEYSCENPVLTNYCGHMLKNVEVCGQVSKNVSKFLICLEVLYLNFMN